MAIDDDLPAKVIGARDWDEPPIKEGAIYFVMRALTRDGQRHFRVRSVTGDAITAPADFFNAA